MHKIIVLLVLCVIRENVYADDLTPEQKEMLKSLHAACVEESGVAENAITEAAKGIFADNRELKCYMKCLFSSIGVMEDDGAIDFESYLDLLPENYKELGEKTAANCRHIVPEGDACETAFKFNKCSYEAAPTKYIIF